MQNSQLEENKVGVRATFRLQYYSNEILHIFMQQKHVYLQYTHCQVDSISIISNSLASH